MQKPRGKQVVITELEADIINDLMKERLIHLVREWNNGVSVDIDMMCQLQKKYEDILNYIRSKDNG